MMGVPVIRSATEPERQKAIDVLMLAFAADPVARWALPDASDYLEFWPTFADAFGGNGLPHGATYVVDDLAGAAFWLPPEVEPDAERMFAMVETNVPADLRDDVMSLFGQMAGFHPDGPHWYLPLVGVDPGSQGRGLGGLLMRHALARCDADGLPAYLESSNPRNLSLYQRHGFEITGTIQVGSSPPVIPMLRLPR